MQLSRLWSMFWPLLFAVMPFVAMWLWPDSTAAELAVIFLVPVGAALTRAATAGRVWATHGIAVPGFWRSLAYAAAVASLMAFEGFMAFLAVTSKQGAGKPPFDAWAWAAWLYAGYVFAMRLTVFNVSEPAAEAWSSNATSELIR